MKLQAVTTEELRIKVTEPKWPHWFDKRTMLEANNLKFTIAILLGWEDDPMHGPLDDQWFHRATHQPT
jgi:hypothetical protein